jgi:GDSL-like Lipase/Acylhydrolase family
MERKRYEDQTTPGGSRTGRHKELIYAILVIAGSLVSCLVVLELVGRVSGLFPAPSGAYRFSATKGYELSPGEGEINSAGLRDREYPVAKPAATFRIVAIGDSFTFGAGVKQGETYPKRLEAMLNERLGGKGTTFEVLDAGVPGYNTYQELIHLREVGLKFNPDLIVLGFTLSDAELGDFGLKDVKDRKWLIQLKEWMKNHLGLYGFLRMRLKRLVDKYNTALLDPDNIGGSAVIPLKLAAKGEKSVGWDLCRQSLEDLGAIARSRSCPILLVLFPFLDQLDNSYPFKAEHALVSRTAHENGIAVLDLLPDFTGLKPSLLWVTPTDSHPNARGHLIAAEAIYRALLTNTLVPSNASSSWTPSAELLSRL